MRFTPQYEDLLRSGKLLLPTIIEMVFVAIMLGLCLFLEAEPFGAKDRLEVVLNQLYVAFYYPEIQWIVVLCVAACFIVFCTVQHKRSDCIFCRVTNPDLWLVLLLAIGLYDYASCYTIASLSHQLLTLLAGATLGKGARLLISWSGATVQIKCRMVQFVGLLVLMLAAISLRHFESGASLWHYNGSVRWSGPWNNPNIYGMLMCLGLTLAIGLLTRNLSLDVQKGRHQSWWAILVQNSVFAVFAIATVLVLIGLVHSYSRGAWLASFFGLLYCGQQWISLNKQNGAGTNNVSSSMCHFYCWLFRNRLSLSVTFVSLCMLFFLHFQETGHGAARRLFSTVNVNDFSWRNRVAAWEGAAQISADHPCFGLGWNQPLLEYDAKYRAVKVFGGQAIETNDYLMLAAMLGIPALFCFGMYVWLSLTRSASVLRSSATAENGECGVRNAKEGRARHSVRAGPQRQEGGAQGTDAPYHDNTPISEEIRDLNMETGETRCPTFELDWLQTTCRAGAIVLLVGFWFDGGLFKLATASTFWILLELGCADLGQQKVTK